MRWLWNLSNATDLVEHGWIDRFIVRGDLLLHTNPSKDAAQFHIFDCVDADGGALDLISFIGLKYDADTVALAMGTTAFIVIAVSLLVWLTPFDFSKLLPIMSIVLLGWIVVVMVTRIIGLAWSRTLYASIGVTIFTIFLAVDLKMITGGGKYELGEDDYILGAIYIYLDIINIFLYLLQLFDNN